MINAPVGTDRQGRGIWGDVGRFDGYDETVVQVLHEPGKKAKTDSRMWVYCTDKSADKYLALFKYSPTRNSSNAVDFLGDYSGYLVCDGYVSRGWFDGYDNNKALRCNWGFIIIEANHIT